MSAFFLMSGEQLEFALHPHDGTPISFLVALRHHLDGFNPDRAQIEKNHARSVISRALGQIRTHAPDQYGAARRLFPGAYAVPDVPVMDEAANDERGEVMCPSCLAGQQPLLPGMVPTMAPDAHRARGTPVSAPSLEPVSCNRGLTLFPASVSRPALSGARSFGIQGNQALA